MTTGTLSIDDRPCTWQRDPSTSGDPLALILLAHGAGAPYTSDSMVAYASALNAAGFDVVRFHFPYMQQMVDSGKRRPPDRAPRCIATWKAIVDLFTDDPLPIVAAGKSMGGRMASMALADGKLEAVCAAVYFGYPFHPAKKPEKLRIEHLPRVPVSQLFISGTKDPLATDGIAGRTVSDLPRAELLEIENGDHDLATSRKAPHSELPRIAEAVREFVESLPDLD